MVKVYRISTIDLFNARSVHTVQLQSIPVHTSVCTDNSSMDPHPFLHPAISCHLPLLCSLTLHLVPAPHSSSHTSTGGLSLVGIHQGPSLTPAMLQRRQTISGLRTAKFTQEDRACVCGCLHAHLCLF